jgi:hypothetical protein
MKLDELPADLKMKKSAGFVHKPHNKKAGKRLFKRNLTSFLQSYSIV